MVQTVPPRIGRRRHAAGFHLVAAVFAVALVFSTLPTPLYGLYQQRDGFAAPVVTVIFAAYAVGVMAGLYFAGHISDWTGRRRVVLGGTVAELASASVFLAWPEVPGLILARLLCGVGIGVLTATVTAHMGELRAVAKPEEDPSRAALAATAVTMGALALGPVVGGVLSEVLDAPLSGAFVPFIVLFVLCVPVLALIPETVERPAEPPAYRPQRVSVPGESRQGFLGAAAGVFAAFAVLGLFTSLAPTLMAGVFDEPSRVVGGVMAFAVLGAGAVAQVGLAGLPAAVRSRWGVLAMVAGLVLTPVAALLGVEPLFWVGGVVAGAGAGLVFRSSVETVSGFAAPGRKAEVLAALFLAAYVGIALPVLGVGLALVWVSGPVALLVFAVPMLALVLWSGQSATTRPSCAVRTAP